MRNIHRISGNLYEFFPGNRMANRAIAWSWYSQGLAAEAAGDSEQALERYRQALDYDPSLAEAWLNRGTILLKRHDVHDAEHSYEKALEADPGYAEAHFNLGNVLAQKRSFRRAIEQYREALRIEPRHAHAHHNLAIECARADDWQEAIEHYRLYIRYSDDSPDELVAAQRAIDYLVRKYTSPAPKLVALESPGAACHPKAAQG